MELAEKRVVRTIKDMRLIGNLANRNNYEFTDKDAQKIISALEKELRAMKAKFENSEASKTIEFQIN